MTTTKVPHRPVAILSLPKKVPALITHAQAIVSAMTGNPAFPSPAPALAALVTAIEDLQTAETAALSRVKGAVAVRNEKRAALVTLLEQEKSYVQTTADANLETATSVIESAHIGVRKIPVHKPRTFEALQGAVSGSAKLVAKSAGARASYEWQYSIDGGKTWVPAPVTLQAKTTITGLTPATSVMFRYRPVTKKGEGDWSQTLSLLVH